MHITAATTFDATTFEDDKDDRQPNAVTRTPLDDTFLEADARSCSDAPPLSARQGGPARHGSDKPRGDSGGDGVTQCPELQPRCVREGVGVGPSCPPADLLVDRPPLVNNGAK